MRAWACPDRIRTARRVGAFFPARARALRTWDPATGEFCGVEGPRGFHYREAVEASRFLASRIQRDKLLTE
jgi:hypothetical protein